MKSSVWLCVLLSFFGSTASWAQAIETTALSKPVWDIGLEVQQYPAGTIPTLRVRRPIDDGLAVTLNAGLNITYRRDLGEQDNERGIGGGGGIGVRYYPLAHGERLHLGVRVDLFFIPIMFDTEAGTDNTDILVLMPTAQIGWTFNLGRWLIAPTLSFGREFNVVEDGDAVGQDFIGLLGVAVAYRLL